MNFKSDALAGSPVSLQIRIEERCQARQSIRSAFCGLRLGAVVVLQLLRVASNLLGLRSLDSTLGAGGFSAPAPNSSLCSHLLVKPGQTLRLFKPRPMFAGFTGLDGLRSTDFNAVDRMYFKERRPRGITLSDFSVTTRVVRTIEEKLTSDTDRGVIIS